MQYKTPLAIKYWPVNLLTNLFGVESVRFLVADWHSTVYFIVRITSERSLTPMNIKVNPIKIRVIPNIFII